MKTMEMDSELTPCPFCSCETLDVLVKNDGFSDFYVVECCKCGAIGPASQENPEEAQTFWNDRITAKGARQTMTQRQKYIFIGIVVFAFWVLGLMFALGGRYRSIGRESTAVLDTWTGNVYRPDGTLVRPPKK
jgi:hypothetical protein